MCSSFYREIACRIAGERVIWREGEKKKENFLPPPPPPLAVCFHALLAIDAYMKLPNLLDMMQEVVHRYWRNMCTMRNGHVERVLC